MFTSGYKKCDTHMHPNLIRKPEQAELFIHRAIERGFDMICFTDHMFHKNKLDASDRMFEDSIPKYCEMVHEISQKYRNEITILCGIEIDYYPPDEEDIRNKLSQGRFDHILGSTHMQIEEIYHLPLNSVSKDEFAEAALDNTLRCVRSGLFDTISHLDFYRWAMALPERFHFANSQYHLDQHIPKINKILAEMEENNICLEVNASGIYKGFDNQGPHPENRIIELAKEYHLQYVYGSDAHMPQNVGECYDEISHLVDLHK